MHVSERSPRFREPGRHAAKVHGGFTLIEAVVFMVVVSIALSTVLLSFNHSVVNSVDPAVQLKALEHAQAHLDAVIARRFDENSPTGGIPACDSDKGQPCLGISPEPHYDDVGDFDGFTDTIDTHFSVAISVQNAGADLGLADSQARLITVNVTAPNGKTYSLSSYKVNF